MLYHATMKTLKSTIPDHKSWWSACFDLFSKSHFRAENKNPAEIKIHPKSSKSARKQISSRKTKFKNHQKCHHFGPKIKIGPEKKINFDFKNHQKQLIFGLKTAKIGLFWSKMGHFRPISSKIRPFWSKSIEIGRISSKPAPSSLLELVPRSRKLSLVH